MAILSNITGLVSGSLTLLGKLAGMATGVDPVSTARDIKQQGLLRSGVNFLRDVTQQGFGVDPLHPFPQITGAVRGTFGDAFRLSQPAGMGTNATPMLRTPTLDTAEFKVEKVKGEDVIKSINLIHQNITKYLNIINKNTVLTFNYVKDSVKTQDSKIDSILRDTKVIQKSYEDLNRRLIKLDTRVKDLEKGGGGRDPFAKEQRDNTPVSQQKKGGGLLSSLATEAGLTTLLRSFGVPTVIISGLIWLIYKDKPKGSFSRDLYNDLGTAWELFNMPRGDIPTYLWEKLKKDTIESNKDWWEKQKQLNTENQKGLIEDLNRRNRSAKRWGQGLYWNEPKSFNEWMFGRKDQGFTTGDIHSRVYGDEKKSADARLDVKRDIISLNVATDIKLAAQSIFQKASRIVLKADVIQLDSPSIIFSSTPKTAKGDRAPQRATFDQRFGTMAPPSGGGRGMAVPRARMPFRPRGAPAAPRDTFGDRFGAWPPSAPSTPQQLPRGDSFGDRFGTWPQQAPSGDIFGDRFGVWPQAGAGGGGQQRSLLKASTATPLLASFEAPTRLLSQKSMQDEGDIGEGIKGGRISAFRGQAGIPVRTGAASTSRTVNRFINTAEQSFERQQQIREYFSYRPSDWDTSIPGVYDRPSMVGPSSTGAPSYGGGMRYGGPVDTGAESTRRFLNRFNRGRTGYGGMGRTGTGTGTGTPEEQGVPWTGGGMYPPGTPAHTERRWSRHAMPPGTMMPSEAKVVGGTPDSIVGANSSGFLSQQRSPLIAEIEKNPALKSLVMGMLVTESGSEGVKGMTATFEALLNRTSMIKEKVPNWSIEKELNSGFYQVIKDGKAQQAAKQAPTKNQLAAFDAGKGGSNLIIGRTDQGMVGDPNAQGPGRVPGFKEIYNFWKGERPRGGAQFTHKTSEEFANRQQQGVADWARQHPDEAGKVIPGKPGRIEWTGKGGGPKGTPSGDFGGDVAAADEYLRKTTGEKALSSTTAQQGVDSAIAHMHPEMRLRLAAAIKEARANGLPDVHAWSMYRSPSMGANPGFAFSSQHGRGVATDVGGIGRPGSPEAIKWQQIAAKHGLVNPYGPYNQKEWNHYQLIPDRAGRGKIPSRPLSVEEMRPHWERSGVPIPAPAAASYAPTPTGERGSMVVFGGLNGILDKESVRKIAKAKGLNPLIFGYEEGKKALEYMRTHPGEVKETLGFSKGVETQDDVLNQAKKENIPLPERATNIGQSPRAGQPRQNAGVPTQNFADDPKVGVETSAGPHAGKGGTMERFQKKYYPEGVPPAAPSEYQDTTKRPTGGMAAEVARRRRQAATGREQPTPATAPAAPAAPTATGPEPPTPQESRILDAAARGFGWTPQETSLLDAAIRGRQEGATTQENRILDAVTKGQPATAEENRILDAAARGVTPDRILDAAAGGRRKAPTPQDLLDAARRGRQEGATTQENRILDAVTKGQPATAEENRILDAAARGIIHEPATPQESRILDAAQRGRKMGIGEQRLRANIAKISERARANEFVGPRKEQGGPTTVDEQRARRYQALKDRQKTNVFYGPRLIQGGPAENKFVGPETFDQEFARRSKEFDDAQKKLQSDMESRQQSYNAVGDNPLLATRTERPMTAAEWFASGQIQNVKARGQVTTESIFRGEELLSPSEARRKYPESASPEETKGGYRGQTDPNAPMQFKESTWFVTGPKGPSATYVSPRTGEKYIDRTQPVGPAVSGAPGSRPGVAIGFRNFARRGEETLGGYYVVIPKKGPNAGIPFVLQHVDIGAGAGTGERVDFTGAATDLVYGGKKYMTGGAFAQYIGRDFTGEQVTQSIQRAIRKQQISELRQNRLFTQQLLVSRQAFAEHQALKNATQRDYEQTKVVIPAYQKQEDQAFDKADEHRGDRTKEEGKDPASPKKKSTSASDDESDGKEAAKRRSAPAVNNPENESPKPNDTGYGSNRDSELGGAFGGNEAPFGTD
jgi:hypothetical protein